MIREDLISPWILFNFILRRRFSQQKAFLLWQYSKRMTLFQLYKP